MENGEVRSSTHDTPQHHCEMCSQLHYIDMLFSSFFSLKPKVNQYHWWSNRCDGDFPAFTHLPSSSKIAARRPAWRVLFASCRKVSPAYAYTLLISSALHNETEYTLHCLSLIIDSAVRSKAQMFVYQERSIATNAIPP